MTRSDWISVIAILVQVAGFGGAMALFAGKVGRMVERIDVMWEWWKGHDERQSKMIEEKVGHVVRGALQQFVLKSVLEERKPFRASQSDI